MADQGARTRRSSALQAQATAHVTKILNGQARLTHPNRPDEPLFVPGLNPAGQPPEVAEALSKITAVIAQAIVATTLDQLDATLIANNELADLTTRADNEPTRTVNVHCSRHQHELMTLPIEPGTDTAKIPCDLLRRNLTECETS